MPAQREPDVLVVRRELARRPERRQGVVPAPLPVARRRQVEQGLDRSGCMRGGTADRALGVAVARLPEIEVAECEIGLRPRGLEPQRLIETSFRAVQVAL